MSIGILNSLTSKFNKIIKSPWMPNRDSVKEGEIVRRINFGIFGEKHHAKLLYLGLGSENNFSRGISGLTLALLRNHSDRNLNGLSVSGIMNSSEGAMKGVQISIMHNEACLGSMSGLQLGGNNISYRSMRGVQIALSGNATGRNMSGVQLGGLCNRAFLGEMSGVQGSLLNYSYFDMTGVQSAFINLSERGDIKGFQVGNVNAALDGDLDGFQVGVINYAGRDMKRVKLGLLNIWHGGKCFCPGANIVCIPTDWSSNESAMKSAVEHVAISRNRTSPMKSIAYLGSSL